MISREQAMLTRSATPGPPLYSYSVAPDGVPGQKAAAVAGILHGYGEHAGRYAHVMDAWAGRGIASVAIDLRGHGRSGGRRGYCERFTDYLDDVRELERLTREKNLPAFLCGHSLGGLVAVSSALVQPSPWRAMVLSAPLLGIAMDVPRVKLIAGKIASRIFPTFSLPSGIRSSDVTHDVALARAYDQDPLVFHIATARWFTEVRTAQERAFARAATLSMPLFVAMGTADRISKYERARAFYDAAGSRDKTWDAREGLFHEVLNEPEWRGIADKMADWMLSHV
jgi:alpha-beta hydrolase superfamily lysophospholipase